MAIEKSNQPDEFRSFEHDGWEANSDGYARHFSDVTKQSVGPMLDAAGVGAGMRVLDVCTGPGMLAEAAAARGASVVGLDFAAQAVASARARIPEVEFVEGDAQALPYPDESFDAVVCGYGIIHVPDPAAALAEMRRVLRPGCRAAVSVWAAPAPDNGFGLLFGALKAHGDLSVPLPHGPDIFQFSDAARMSAALAEAQFGDIETAAVPQSWHMDDPLGLVTGVVEGTIRARALYLAQTAEARKAIEAAVVAGMAAFPGVGNGFAVPMPAVVGSGAR
ncbi:MAG TPA: methyltransferase domain-containing protein [Thermohalobaculum sp.]|nr:methyltransferase domain-containing protein [Thermohalobaculum sp.]